jgi:hypothetical protein
MIFAHVLQSYSKSTRRRDARLPRASCRVPSMTVKSAPDLGIVASTQRKSPPSSVAHGCPRPQLRAGGKDSTAILDTGQVRMH